jgi:hypothetical protein
MNRLHTRADLENLFDSLSNLYFPFIDGEVAANTTIVIESGHVIVTFEVNRTVYNFVLNASANWGWDYIPTIEEILSDWEKDGPVRLVKDGDGVTIYLATPADGRIIFVMDIQGVYAVVNYFAANEMGGADLQAAIDGMLAFEYRSIVEYASSV